MEGIRLPFKFECTIAVSCGGSQVLVSKLPKEVASLACLDGEFLDDNGWYGLPKETGVYQAIVRARWNIDEPDVEVLGYSPTSWKTIREVELEDVQNVE